MSTKLNSTTFTTALETMNNLSKLGANLSSDKPKTEKRSFKEGDNLNQPHSQTVEVKVGSEPSQQKPVVVHEKKETHIHKPYPDSRNLTKEECEVETLRIQLEAQDKKEEREYRMWLEENNRKERKEREELARKDRERRRAEEKKLARRICIGAGVCAAVGLGFAAYDYYTHSRVPGYHRLAISAPKVTTAPASIESEGTVE